MVRILFVFWLSSTCWALHLRAQNIVIEEGGLVIIEVEMTDAESWVLDTTIKGYTGDGYLLYTGNNLFNNPGNALLSYVVRIEKAGKYRFQWYSRIATGESNTEHNDSWLRFPDASKFYAVRDDHIVYPKGTGLTPNPNGSSSKGWFKVYQNALGRWTWNTSTSDHEPHNIFVEFDTAGIYKLEISGRSNGHAIDRLALYHESVASQEALDLATSPSDIDMLSSSFSSTRPIKMKIAPNPTYDEIRMDLSGMESQIIFVQLANIYGTIIMSRSFAAPGKLLQISMADLPSGTYFLNASDQVNNYMGRFVKL